MSHCVGSRSYSARIRDTQDAEGAGASYVHTQASASATWTINHNLGFRPAIDLYTVGGAEFIAEILHTSLNQAIVYLATSLAGTARCN